MKSFLPFLPVESKANTLRVNIRFFRSGTYCGKVVPVEPVDSHPF